MKLTHDNLIAFWSNKDPKIGIFSNWYTCTFKDNSGRQFNCTEQFMMYYKAKLFKDFEIAEKIMSTTDQKTMKDLGRQVHNFDEAVWNKVKYAIVYQANFFKFTQNPDLEEALLATSGKVLVEASPYDKIWGVGMSASNNDILDTHKWRGENLLGKILMHLRMVLICSL